MLCVLSCYSVTRFGPPARPISAPCPRLSRVHVTAAGGVRTRRYKKSPHQLLGVAYEAEPYAGAAHEAGTTTKLGHEAGSFAEAMLAAGTLGEYVFPEYVSSLVLYVYLSRG